MLLKTGIKNKRREEDGIRLRFLRDEVEQGEEHWPLQQGDETHSLGQGSRIRRTERKTELDKEQEGGEGSFFGQVPHILYAPCILLSVFN